MESSVWILSHCLILWNSVTYWMCNYVMSAPISYSARLALPKSHLSKGYSLMNQNSEDCTQCWYGKSKIFKHICPTVSRAGLNLEKQLRTPLVWQLARNDLRICGISYLSAALKFRLLQVEWGPTHGSTPNAALNDFLLSCGAQFQLTFAKVISQQKNSFTENGEI